MDELINLVSQRTGIPADKAQLAVTTVVGFLKDKLPAPIATQLDSLVSGGGAGVSGSIADGGGLGSVVNGIESMFGNRA